MIELLAQAVVEAEAASKIFGLSVAEWSVLLTALLAFADAVRSRLKASSGDSKLQIVMEAIEETHELHPEAGRLAKRIARSKATRMGIEVGAWGLEGDAKRLTRRLEKRKAEGDKLAPGDPPPDPETPA